MSVLRRIYQPFRLQKIKGKYYLSVTAPKEIAHCYREGRVRRSTGISDKKLAELKAQELVHAIYRDFDLKFDQLDPFVEGLRHLLEREGIDVGQWYRKGEITAVVAGNRTFIAGWIDTDRIRRDGKPVNFREEWTATNHVDIAHIVTILGYAVPSALLAYVAPEARERIEKASEFQALKASEGVQLYKKDPDFYDSPIGQQFLDAASKPRQMVRIDQLKEQTKTPVFSKWAKLYIDAKQTTDTKDVHRKRVMACDKFVAVCGDKPLDQYDKINALELAQALDAEGRSNATIKNYYSYMRQAFEYAETQRGEDGKVVLSSHPFHNVDLSSYGKKKKSYQPLSTDELHQLFKQSMAAEDRLLLSILVTTGMRLDEVALLRWEQIKEHDGVLCFDLTGPDVRVKNEGSRRRVPVPTILKHNFTKRGTGRLFTYRIDEEGKAETAASKTLMKIVRKVTKERTKVIHSLRGNFKDFLRDMKVSKETNDYLTGHHHGDVASRYGTGPSLPSRREVIDAVDHPWLSLPTSPIHR